jgi:hypothetical protein
LVSVNAEAASRRDITPVTLMWRGRLPIAREGNLTPEPFNPEQIDAISRFDMKMPAEDLVKMLPPDTILIGPACRPRLTEAPSNT